MASELARSSVPGLSDEEVHQLLSVFKQEGTAPPIEKLGLPNPAKDKFVFIDMLQGILISKKDGLSTFRSTGEGFDVTDAFDTAIK